MTLLNPEDKFDICDQRSAILKKSGHMLVIGGPGSGKTTVALLKARRCVLEKLLAEQTVLFLSFSNAAIRRILESAGDILALDIAKQVEIKTYHSFAWDILKSHGYLTSKQRGLKIVSAQDAAIRSAGLDKMTWGDEQNRLYVEEGLVTYDQFARRAAEILSRSNAAQRCFNTAHPLILVDEFQDTDEDQWSLIRALSDGSDIVALGDKEQRIYEWRDGVSEERLSEFGEVMDASLFDFQNENNRSPATGIAGYARSLLSPSVVQALPEDIEQLYFKPGRFDASLRLSLIRTWKETVKRTERTDLRVAIAARNKNMVRMISDVLASTVTIRGKKHKPISHDVLFNQDEIVLAARVISNVMGSTGFSRNERLAQSLHRIADMQRVSNKATNIKRSDTLNKWGQKCADGIPPKTICVKALASILDGLDRDGFVGSPAEDWLKVRKALDSSDVNDLTKTGEFARYLRLLRRGSLIEEQLSNLWRMNGNYIGAEEALEQAILQNQLLDSHRESARFSVMSMHQLKGREYDAVMLVEDQYRTFRAQESEPPFQDTRRLLHVSLTRAKHFATILSANNEATLVKISGVAR